MCLTSNMPSITIEARIANISIITHFIDTVLPNIDKKIKTRMYIAADEVFSNIVRHGRLPQNAAIDVNIDTTGDKAVITFTDSGVPFNPLEQGGLYVAPSNANDRIDGLGTFLLAQIADGLEYQRRDETNILTLTFDLYACKKPQPQ